MKQAKNSDELKKRPLTDTGAQNSLKDEILQLQKQLQDQFEMRYAMEKASSCSNILHEFTSEITICEPAKDLIEEIAALELEIKYLENYLLTMYRKILGKILSSLSLVDEREETNSVFQARVSSEVPEPDTTSTKANSVMNNNHYVQLQDSSDNPFYECDNILGAHTLINSGVCRSQSSLSRRSPFEFGTSAFETFAEAFHSNQSLPLSMLERVAGTTSSRSLAEHLDNIIHNRVQESPNLLSEKMIKCISAIYCQLADPPLFNHGFPSSPISLSSSISNLSPQPQPDVWGPQSGENSHYNLWFNEEFDVQLPDEVKGSFITLAEVHRIRRDNNSLQKVELMMENFRHFVSRLEEVDIKHLKHEEKLAFWINVHNSLVMHALLVYGIPQSNLKRISLILKAAYNIGGHSMTLNAIQSSILGCWLPRPGQWLQSLFFPRAKYKGQANPKAYAIEHPEPRLYFALASGSHSDPPVRLYTPKTVFQELEVAKEEYIQTSIRLHKEQKLILPKIVDSFMKELSLSPSSLEEMIEYYLPASLRLKKQQFQRGKIWKKIVWTPHDFNFRFQLSNELAPC